MKKTLPEFASEQEEQDFWRTADSTEEERFAVESDPLRSSTLSGWVCGSKVAVFDSGSYSGD
jgi:hypothetical protein